MDVRTWDGGGRTSGGWSKDFEFLWSLFNKIDVLFNSFETQNGISIAQVGKLKDNKTFVVMGSYAYTGADGKRYRVR